MYYIQGADQKEYGPISADQLRQWITENRLNRFSPARADGESLWKTLGDFPEFADVLAALPASIAAPPASPSSGSSVGSSQSSPYGSGFRPSTPGISESVIDQKLKIPAIGVIVTGALGGLLSLYGVIATLVGSSKNTELPPGLPPEAAGFLDELVTWRELGFNYTAQRDDYEDFESLPDWAKATLGKHAADPREHLYSLEDFAESRTHDPVWNAAQTQLRETGVMQNYLRMLWGKKVLEWTRAPQEAFGMLIELNNRYALDGRDPNSYTGISWVFGRYDRPWAPERDVYGVIRYMSSTNTVKKLRIKEYLARWAR